MTLIMSRATPASRAQDSALCRIHIPGAGGVAYFEQLTIFGCNVGIFVSGGRLKRPAAPTQRYTAFNLRTTTSTVPLFLAIMFAGKMPRQLTFG